MNIKPSDYAFLRHHENEEWNRNGLGTKANIKRKIQTLKDSVKRRRDISREDYIKLIRDRQNRIDRITGLRDVMLSQTRLFRLGITQHQYREIFEVLQTDSDLNNLLDEGRGVLGFLDEAIFQKELTRQDLRSYAKKVEASAPKDFDVSELGIDWLIWRFEPYVEVIAHYVGVKLEDLTLDQVAWIVKLTGVDTLDFHPNEEGIALPHWYMKEPMLTGARLALPGLSDRLHPQE